MNDIDEKVGPQVPQYVGFWPRFGTAIIDSLILLILIVPVMIALYGDGYWNSGKFINGTGDVMANYLFPLIATVLFWIYKAATPGKMVLKMKIVDAKTGQKPTAKQALIRYLGYYVSLLPFGLGFLWVAFDRKKQGWHDKLAGTVVIKDSAGDES